MPRNEDAHRMKIPLRAAPPTCPQLNAAVAREPTASDDDSYKAECKSCGDVFEYWNPVTGPYRIPDWRCNRCRTAEISRNEQDVEEALVVVIF